MKWFKRQSKEQLVYEGITLLLFKQTSDAVKGSSQNLEKHLDATDQPKLPKVEEELLYFFVFALDYWIQQSYNSPEQKHLLRQAFHTHLANIVEWETLQQRFLAYGQIVNEAKGDNAKYLSFGTQLSKYCDMPSVLFWVIAPSLFTAALQTVSEIKPLLPKP